MPTFALIAEHPPDLCPTSNAQTRQILKEGASQIPQLAEQLGVNRHPAHLRPRPHHPRRRRSGRHRFRQNLRPPKPPNAVEHRKDPRHLLDRRGRLNDRRGRGHLLAHNTKSAPKPRLTNRHADRAPPTLTPNQPAPTAASRRRPPNLRRLADDPLGDSRVSHVSQSRSESASTCAPCPSPDPRSAACSLRARALIGAVVCAGRRCWSQGRDERRRPPNRAAPIALYERGPAVKSLA